MCGKMWNLSCFLILFRAFCLSLLRQHFGFWSSVVNEQKRRHQTVTLGSEWPLFPPSYFSQCIDWSAKLHFHCALFLFGEHFFSFYSEKSGQARHNARYFEWMRENQHNAWSVKPSRDWKINNVCFYCREWYQRAQELWIILLANMVPWKSSFIQRNWQTSYQSHH